MESAPPAQAVAASKCRAFMPLMTILSRALSPLPMAPYFLTISFSMRASPENKSLRRKRPGLISTVPGGSLPCASTLAA